MNLLIVFLIGSRVSSEINPSSILESKNSIALSTDSLAPLATKEAIKGSANLSDTPDSRTISLRKNNNSVLFPSFIIAFGLFFFCGFLSFL